MKNIRIFMLSIITFAILLSVNIYAVNAAIEDSYITCNEDGTISGKGEEFTKADITVSGLDESGYYTYYGIDVGVFKKPTTGDEWDTIFVERIPTDSLQIEIENFGDITKYEYTQVYKVGYRVLYRPNGIETNPIVEGDWSQIGDSYFKIKSATAPTINTPTITGTGYFGEDVSVSATGTNIATAAYRIFYTTSPTQPTVATDQSSSPGNGWLDSNQTGTLTVNSNTDIAGIIRGDYLTNISWTYVTFKIGVGSSNNQWDWRYTQAYKLSDNPNISKGNGVDSYIQHVQHNQIINTPTKDIVVSDPHTPVGAYTVNDIGLLESYNVFIDKDFLKYRLEFDVLKAEDIKDIKFIFDFNSLNEDGIEMLLNGIKLYQLKGDSYQEIKNLSLLCHAYKPQSKNRYVVTLGNDSNGVPIIKANGRGRYAIGYGGILKINTAQQGSAVTIENEVEMRVYVGGLSDYAGTVNKETPSNKIEIDTRVSKSTIGYR